jgi:hypothetical protein
VTSGRLRAASTAAVCSVAMTVGALCSSAAATAGPLTPPSADPFYQPPASYAAAPNGSVLASRQETASSYGVPLPVHAWQLLYRSENATGGATAEVTTVMVPDAAWTGTGKRPVVSYQTAEDSVSSRCAPSYAIRSGLLAIDSNAGAEVGLMASLLQRGWAVVTSDYEGPESQFLAGRQEGHGVLDGIRAALSYSPDGLGTGGPVALWGYSGGAFASSWAAELQPHYAPSLRFAGIAIGGDPADLVRAFEQVDGSYGAGLVFGGIIGLERAFPAAGIEQMFTAAGRQALAAGVQDCTDELLLQYPFAHVASYTYSAHPFAATSLGRALVANSPLGNGAPAAGTPVYDYHATPDELVPVAVDDDLVTKWCAAGAPVQEVRYAYGDHNSTLLTGEAAAVQFLADRFAGDQVVDDCPPIVAAPAREVVIRSGRLKWQSRPRTILIGGRRLVGLRWSRWGARSSTARGRVGCSGRRCPKRKPSVRIAVSKLQQCFTAQRPLRTVLAYTTLRYSILGRRPRMLRLTCPPS